MHKNNFNNMKVDNIHEFLYESDFIKILFQCVCWIYRFLGFWRVALNTCHTTIDFLPFKANKYICVLMNVSICTRKFVTHNVPCEQMEKKEKEEEVENVIQVLFPIHRLASSAQCYSLLWKQRNYFNCFIHKWTYLRCSHNI